MRTMKSSRQQKSLALPSDSIVSLHEVDQRPSSPSVSTTTSKNTSSPPSSPPLGPRPLLSHLFGGRSKQNENSTSKTNNQTASSPHGRDLKDEHRTASTKRTNDNKKKTPAVRVGADDEQLRRHRRTVNHYVRRIGAIMGSEVELNERGMAFFSFQQKFVIVFEVPEDNHNFMYLYTKVCQADQNVAAIVKRAMELNYMQQGTAGATLGLDGEEINFCFSCKIAHLTFEHLRSDLEKFLLAAIAIHKELDTVKNQPVGVSSQSEEASRSSIG